MSMTQSEKGLRFQELHRRREVLLIPNPWDAGSARILAGLGFEALATSSGAFAAVRGRRDGSLTLEQSVAGARAIVEATDLPVSADLENGFGHEPGEVAAAIKQAAEAGLVGASIEDATGDPGHPLYELAFATERITSAVQAARALPFPFVVTARAENYVRGKGDLREVIERLQAYERAGADVLFAVCSAVSRPVNFMVGIRGKSFSVSELVAAGVKRISFASSLYRASLSALSQAASEAKNLGTFSYLERTLTTAELNRFLLD
jgi:2-methylisocitrate lyase-like PEP mutase family enzyme